MVSQDGDTYETCLANQRALYEQALALLPSGWTLGLKIHPLAAAWHDVATNQPICDALGITLHPGDWPGKYIFAYDAIISLGSSLIFENIGSGVPCFIASFLGGRVKATILPYQNFIWNQRMNCDVRLAMCILML